MRVAASGFVSQAHHLEGRKPTRVFRREPAHLETYSSADERVLGKSGQGSANMPSMHQSDRTVATNEDGLMSDEETRSQHASTGVARS
jgi:hypothetical protein